MTFDGLHFPRLTQYLRSVPQGLDAHPSAVTKADFSLILRQKLVPVAAQAPLPSALARLLEAPWQAGDWVPIAHYAALCAIARDRLWPSDHAYHSGMVAVASELYSDPAYRTLFAVFGPSLVAMSAAKRWDSLHRGTQLITKKQYQSSIELQLNYPRKLICASAAQSLGAAFCAIALASRAQEASCQLGTVGDTATEMTITWRL